MIKDALLSDDGVYRYWLLRQWAPGLRVCFVMLNPSTADADVDDPTIRRCMGFARDWGYSGIVVVNLFAFRATNPKELSAATVDPVGPDNDAAIALTIGGNAAVICAWGAHGSLLNRGAQVLDIIRRSGGNPSMLRMTKGGHPAHPLYLPRTCVPTPLP